jgi:hypothetical protein
MVLETLADFPGYDIALAMKVANKRIIGLTLGTFHGSLPRFGCLAKE